ncbi:TEA domain protein [Rhizoctonia solani 123E]|uniref:TEA domain protein n=1 Tax=Rhizoctonia solani 123E TaxID=1423351 RepID=A0A074S8I8_9AGAM|nr:TEA domain protein [Rhizoctonia solani 123E]
MSGDLPRLIKGDSLHHAFTSNDNNQFYTPYAYAPPATHHPFSQASSSTSGLTPPTRPEFAVPALPQRSRALVPQNLGSLSTSTNSVSALTSRRSRRPYAGGERHDAIWSPEVQEAFLQAARSIPNNGKNWIMRDGRQYGRNALIAEEIFRLTGQQRTRQQISSHIQVLKKVHADDLMMMRILNGQLEESIPSTNRPATATPPVNRFGSNSISPPAVKAEDPGSSASPPPMPNMEQIENLMNGQSFMSVIRSSAPGSVTSDTSLPGTPQSPPSTSHSDSRKESVQIAELLPRSDMPNIPISRVLSEPLVADRPEMAHPRAWRGERLAYITAITIWAEKTLKDEGVRSRPTTTHVFAQMHSATCPLEPLTPDIEDIVRQIQPGTCMHAEIGIALPPPGASVGKIRSTLVVEAMKEFDGYCLTDAFYGQEGRFMSTHTTVFPTGREAREKYSWVYEIPYAPEIWRKVLKEHPKGPHGMRLVQKYVRSLAGGNRDGDLNVPLLVVHDIKVVPAGETGYSRIRHVDLTGEQAKHDALGVSVVGADDDSDESGPMDGDGDVDMDDEIKRAKPNLSVAIPPPAEDALQLRTRVHQLASSQASQPVTPFEQLVHTPQHPPPFAERQEARRGWWAPTPIEANEDVKISLEDQMNGILGHALGDGGNRMAWITRDALEAGTPTLSGFGGRDHQGLDTPVRIHSNNGYFAMP